VRRPRGEPPLQVQERDSHRVAGDHPEERKLKTIISGDERRRRDHERDEKLSREAFLPLFTGVRGRRILRTSP
jgi:hypothetical protein